MGVGNNPISECLLRVMSAFKGMKIYDVAENKGKNPMDVHDQLEISVIQLWRSIIK